MSEDHQNFNLRLRFLIPATNGQRTLI